jgi:acid phosphatase type 7
MRLNAALIAALAVIAVGAAAVVLAEEKSENVAGPGTAAQGSGEDEWIASIPGETAMVWAVGDANPPNSADVVRLIRRSDPDMILYLGDVYPEGSRDDFTRWAKPWRGLVRRMAPTPGKHEWENASEGYEPYWREVTGQTPPTHYSFDAGGWEILSVNGELTETGPVESWLRDKASSGGNCRIAFWHRPPYSAGKYEEGDPRAREYWDELRGGARIITTGHDHDMQRLRRRDGITLFISGAGGRHRHNVDENDPKLAFGDDDHFGALRLLLSEGRAKWRFVSARGRVLDSGSLSCRP